MTDGVTVFYLFNFRVTLQMFADRCNDVVVCFVPYKHFGHEKKLNEMSAILYDKSVRLTIKNVETRMLKNIESEKIAQCTRATINRPHL